MPMYMWQDRKTDYEVEIIRTFSEYEVPPQDDDLPSEEQGKDRDWVRLISAPGMVFKWPSTSGSVKGRA